MRGESFKRENLIIEGRNGVKEEGEDQGKITGLDDERGIQET